ncbi:MAG TPA: helix-turn-helix transcriptional regulator [Chthoniobacteraceae bacterium]|nr:helix-turn-helix transcriptional regulator [Chthoniobacteraceae bacterium]
MPLSPDWESLSPLLLRLYSELNPDRYVRVLLEVVKELVPADSVVLNIFEIATSRYTVRTLPERIAEPGEVELVGRYLNESPFPPYFVATGDTQWKMTTDFMPLEDFHATQLHRLGLSRWGINQQMCGLLGQFDGAAHAITINRTRRDFTERDRDVLNAIHPHLVTSYLNVQAFREKQHTLSELRSALDAAPGAYGYIQDDGRVSWLQPIARDWLGEAFPDEVRGFDGLPVSVRHLIEEARVTGATPSHVSRTAEKARFAVCLLPSQLGGWILRLERLPKDTHLKLKPVPGLTDRENEVLRWMAEGKRNGEIAVILEVSPRTVEKHVEAILRALEVENRATAIVRAIELSAGA